MSFAKIKDYAEFLSFLALILGVPFGLVDFHNHAVENQQSEEKERVEAAERAYETVDERYTEFVKLCIDHPELDCYSVSLGQSAPPLSGLERVKQKMLFTHLTDVFEVAYVQYHKQQSNPEIKKLYDAQWSGWDIYIKKFLSRRAYLDTWNEIGNEYDDGFVSYMKATSVSLNKP